VSSPTGKRERQKASEQLASPCAAATSCPADPVAIHPCPPAPPRQRGARTPRLPRWTMRSAPPALLHRARLWLLLLRLAAVPRLAFFATRPRLWAVGSHMVRSISGEPRERGGSPTSFPWRRSRVARPGLTKPPGSGFRESAKIGRFTGETGRFTGIANL
jgi:hypothetical protein